MNLDFVRRTSLVLTLVGLTSIAASARADVSLTGATSKPDFNVYIPGETVPIRFEARDLPPDVAPTVQLRVVDEHFKPLVEQRLPLQKAGEHWIATFQAPNQRLGFYRVYATLPNGVTLPRLGSRRAGFLTYCIVPNPAQRPQFSMRESRFGMQGGFNGALNPLPYLGVRWVNGPFDWNWEEPESPGQFAQKRAAKRAKGEVGASHIPGATRGYEWCKVPHAGKPNTPWPIYPVFSLYKPPDWAIVPGSRVLSAAILTPSGKQAWATYCREVGRAVAEDYPNLEEHIYQLTWEPNWFSGSPEEFLSIYQIAYKAIHEVDPKAVIAGPTKAAVGKYSMEQEKAWFDRGFGNNINLYTVHPYFKGIPEQTGYIDDVRALKEFVRQSSGKAMPIAGTEQGRLTHEDPQQEIDQARELIRANLISLGEGMRFNFGFYIHDYHGEEPGFGYFYNLREDEKFGTERIAPKPIVPAFAAQSFLIDGHESTGAIEWLGETALGYGFQRGQSVVLALWDHSSKPRHITLNTGVKTVELYDWMGNKRVLPTRNGQLQLTLSTEPVYIKGVSPSLWGRGAKKPLVVKQTRLRVAPGHTFVLTGETQTSATVAAKGTLTFRPDERLGLKAKPQSIALVPGKPQPFKATFTIPVGAAPGTYALRALLSNGSQTLGAGLTLVTVEPPLRINSVLPSATTAQAPLTAVHVALEETLGQRVTGKLQVELAGAGSLTQDTPVTLKPNERKVIPVLVNGIPIQLGRTHEVTIRVVDAQGYTTTSKSTLGLLAIPRAQTPIQVDAALQDWTPIPPRTLTGKEWIVRKQELYKGDSDLQLNYRFAWDENALYVAVEVTDDVLLRVNPKEELVNSDSLQLAINLDPGKVEQATGNTYADKLNARRYSRFDLALTQEGPRVQRSLTFLSDEYPLGTLSPEQFPVQIQRKGTALIYEVAIPWKTLGGLPSGSIGIALAANDRDAAASDYKSIGLFGGVQVYNASDQLGTAVLLP